MKKILFIEDEPALQTAFTDAITDSGYQTFSALDGEIGVNVAIKEMPDLILLDLILPKMDGFAVLESLKKNLETAHIPVIVLSNLGEAGDVQRAIELGAQSYLVKTNYDLAEVIVKIRATLGE